MLMIVTINPISMQNIFQQITLYTKPSFKSQREHQLKLVSVSWPVRINPIEDKTHYQLVG